MDLYDVIFEGKILPGKNINTVKAEFAKLFKISSPKKLNSFFSGHPVVLKKAISLEQSDNYERALLGVGAYCHHKLIETEKPIESIDFDLTQAEDVQPVVEDDVIEAAENTTVDDAVEEQVTAIVFEYGAGEALDTLSEDEVVELEPVSSEPDESGDDLSADPSAVGVEFEYGTVEELDSLSKDEILESELASAVASEEANEEPGDDQSVEENSVAIEFEYAELGQKDSPDSHAPKQEALKDEPVVSVSLAEMSLVSIEEDNPEDEG
jgi:hypothetical protein